MIKRTGPDPLLRSLCRAACVTLANASLVFCAGIGQAAGQASEPTPLESAQVVPETAAPSLYPPIPTRPSSASNTQAPVSLSAPTTISPGRTPGTLQIPGRLPTRSRFGRHPALGQLNCRWRSTTIAARLTGC